MWRERQGGALMLAVGYLAVMTLAASGFLAMLHHRMGVVRDLERAQSSRHLAEAGIEAGIAGLLADAGAYRGEFNVVLGNGQFSVSVVPESQHGVYVLESTGEVRYDGVVMSRKVICVRVTLDAAGGLGALEWNVESVS